MSDEPIYARTPDGGLATFHGPGLLRKPRLGEVLVSRRTRRRMVVDHFDTMHPNIVHYRDSETGAWSSFVWSFRDGLNRLVRHEESEDVSPLEGETPTKT